MFTKENLTKIKKMNELAPEVMKAFWAFDKLSVAEGAIPVKYKELIAVAVAVTTQCPYCIDIHAANARRAGATEAELAEAAIVAAALRAGGAITHFSVGTGVSSKLLYSGTVTPNITMAVGVIPRLKTTSTITED